MATTVSTGAPTIFIRRAAFEASGLLRAAIDERLGLTADEFAVDGDMVVVGPIYGAGGNAIGDLIAEFEQQGLVYYDDFFELTGNWPAWLKLIVAGT